MERIIQASINSWRAARFLAKNEAAFRQEIGVLVLALPCGWFLAGDWDGYFLLVGSILLVMLVEVLNTAVEAACDAVSDDFHEEIRLAKDCGSLAVAISIVIACMVWLLALAHWLDGAQIWATAIGKT